MADIEFVYTDELPKCLHCDKELNEIRKSSRGSLEKHVFYSCPNCKKLLSIGYNKGGIY